MTPSEIAPPVGIVVRQATDDDLTEIGRIAVDAYRADGQLSDENRYERALRDASHRARYSELLVAVDADRVVGSVALCEPGSRLAEICHPGELEFRMLSVDPAAQGRGIGATLVTACLDRARRRGCEAVVICTRDEVAKTAQRMYLRLGFERLPDRDWIPEGTDIHLIAWRHDLTISV